MINFRFHLVSLVAVFLALGVGVTMGASFVDRATVETLRDRLDQLEGNYRERGTEIDDLHDQLRSVDEANATLLAEDSAVTAGRLAGRQVVVVAPESLPSETVDATWAALQSADASRAGTLRLLPTLDLADEAVLAGTRTLLGLESASPSLVRGRLTARLAGSLALLTGAPPTPGPEPGAPGGDGATTTTTTTSVAPGQRDLRPTPTEEELASARSFIEDLEDLGLIAVDTGGTGDQAFPAVTEVSYVLLLADGTPAEVVESMQRLAKDIAEDAPATVTVGEAAPPRQPGEVSDVEEDRVGSMLVDLRNDDEAVDRLSTVDHLDEALGRLALVLAVVEQADGRVGHYGTGSGALAPMPTSER